MRNARTVFAIVVVLVIGAATVSPAPSANAAPAPLVRVTPTRLDFGPVPVGTPSTQTVSVTNVGSTPWTVGMLGGGHPEPLPVRLDQDVLDQVLGQLAVTGQHHGVPEQPGQLSPGELVALHAATDASRARSAVRES